MLKTCLWCNKEKQLADFGTNNAKKDRKSIYCKMCEQVRCEQYRNSTKGRQNRIDYRKKIKGSAREKVNRNRAVRRIGNRFRMNISVAARRGKSWTITIDQYKHLMQMPCHYCGGPLPETAFGLDRLDNKVGYELQNVVPCCTLCNMARRDQFTSEEMKLFVGPAIRKVREARKEVTMT